MMQTSIVHGHCVNKIYKHYNVIVLGHRDLKNVYVFYLNIGWPLVCCQNVYILNRIILSSEIEKIFNIFTTLCSQCTTISCQYTIICSQCIIISRQYTSISS